VEQNAFADGRAKARHAIGQPSRYAAAMQRKIGVARASHLQPLSAALYPKKQRRVRYSLLGASFILNIAHIDTGHDFRGGQDLLLSLARGLKRRGHSQVIVCPEGSPLARRAAAEELQVRPLETVGKLRSQLREEHFDIVHAHDAKAQTISIRASLGLAVRRVASRQVAFTPRHPLIHRWKYSRTCHAVIANSQSVRQVLIAAGVPDSHIEVILPGIEMPGELPAPEARAKARSQWGYSSDEFVIGHAGAFTREKGQDVALAAAMLLAPRLPRARMLLAGDGPERSKYRMQWPAAIAQFPGFIEDLAEFYAALDLYIMPSRSEAWGLTALGAMAIGVPVIASNVGGLPELVAQTGWLVPPESPEALAEAIVDAASDPARLCEFGRSARERASQFSIERTVEQTEQLYLRLLAAPTSP
jgi:glycosyltransferase involved in cell wall biosynthesis